MQLQKKLLQGFCVVFIFNGNGFLQPLDGQIPVAAGLLFVVGQINELIVGFADAGHGRCPGLVGQGMIYQDLEGRHGIEKILPGRDILFRVLGKDTQVVIRSAKQAHHVLILVVQICILFERLQQIHRGLIILVLVVNKTELVARFHPPVCGRKGQDLLKSFDSLFRPVLASVDSTDVVQGVIAFTAVRIAAVHGFEEFKRLVVPLFLIQINALPVQQFVGLLGGGDFGCTCKQNCCQKQTQDQPGCSTLDHRLWFNRGPMGFFLLFISNFVCILI